MRLNSLDMFGNGRAGQALCTPVLVAPVLVAPVLADQVLATPVLATPVLAWIPIRFKRAYFQMDLP